MGDKNSEAVIIGGGLAGLACAVTLADRGVSVSLFESRPRLGGRASSFEDKQTQALIDNCQHVSMGCCEEFNRFCQTVGISYCFRREKQLYFVGPAKSNNDLSASNESRARFKVNSFAASSWLPAPLHLLPAFGGLSYLSIQEKMELVRGLKRLARIPVDFNNEPTMAEWLADQGQSQNVINRFWNVVLVSALSESLERISLSHAQKVFVDGFLRARDNWQVLIPTVPLEQLYGDVILRRLEQKQAKVHLQTGVERVQIEAGKVVGVQLRDGQDLSCERVIIAVPHQRVLSLLPDTFKGRESLESVEQIEAAPITSVHLWFDREITELPHAVFVDCLSQWMFNRSRIMQPSSETDFYYQIVISASHHLRGEERQGRSQKEIIAEVVEELSQIWPETRRAKLIHSRMVTEHQAVFSVQPGIEELRPSQRTDVSGLYLAGDWTSTGWPATMEGAVRSGLKAAEFLLDDLGQGESLLLQQTQTGILSKILFRL
ncbi:hydroxysqualene dehydroxylase HpnE [Gimesia aquarii]|uniref:15-cis-phytoene desaturase n=1 Tax=Gimesia aquarii TaxID=2527964 RepID=A0A517WPQ6_9PLAN|nr:hydroxysqualene dehydroxylase HpnE [Gimesia aquarii]QDU07247.1 15-cis-phytoene desaturase [Gimesia aquarii]